MNKTVFNSTKEEKQPLMKKKEKSKFEIRDRENIEKMTTSISSDAV